MWVVWQKTLARQRIKTREPRRTQKIIQGSVNELKHRVIPFPAIKKEKEERFCIRDVPVLTSVVVQGFSKQKEIVLQDPYLFHSDLLKGNSEAVQKFFLRYWLVIWERLGWSCLSGDCSSPFSRMWLPEGRSGGLKHAEGHTCLEYRGWWVIAGVRALLLSVMVQKLRQARCAERWHSYPQGM